MTKEQLVTRSIFHSIRERLVSEGWLPDIMALDIDNPNDTNAQSAAKQMQWENQLKAIAQNKGYVIELFNYGSNQTKGLKKVPRIVINNMSFLPSAEIGNDPSVFYEREGDYFTRKQSDNLLSDLTFVVYAVGNKDEQMYNMNAMILKSLPKMGYIKYYNEDFLYSGNLFVKLTDKGETEDLPEGIMERYFVYQMKDLEEIEPTELENKNIVPIDDINLETEIE